MQRPNPELRLRWTWMYPWCLRLFLQGSHMLGAEPFSTARKIPHELVAGLAGPVQVDTILDHSQKARFSPGPRRC